MAKKDPRIDAYIEGSAAFARPILTRLRRVVHASCPDVEETLKWRSPAFMYKGILCGMAAFREQYVEWIAGAKGEETRRRRVDTAVAWMAEGKVRNWKYIRK